MPIHICGSKWGSWSSKIGRGDSDGSTSYLQTLNIEWESAAKESEVITDSPSNGRDMPVEVIEEAQKSVINRSSFPSAPFWRLDSSRAAISISFDF